MLQIFNFFSFLDAYVQHHRNNNLRDNKWWIVIQNRKEEAANYRQHSCLASQPIHLPFHVDFNNPDSLARSVTRYSRQIIIDFFDHFNRLTPSSVSRANRSACFKVFADIKPYGWLVAS
jgi:hypothetical protein